MITIHETYEFKKDFKKLLKRFRTLKEDLKIVKKNTIELYHDKGIDNQSVFQIQKVSTETVKIFKVKKFACKTLKGKGAKSGMRLIYSIGAGKNKVDLLEIYFKGDKAEMDFDRAKRYLQNKR